MFLEHDFSSVSACFIPREMQDLMNLVVPVSDEPFSKMFRAPDCIGALSAGRFFLRE